MYRARCLCGDILFEVDTPLSSPRYCHCNFCAKFAGTRPAAWAITNTDGLFVRAMASPVSKFDSGQGIRNFCSRCGSPLWFESKVKPAMLAVPLGAFDDEELPAPEMHIFVDSNPQWCVISDDLPCHGGPPPAAGG